MSMLGNNPDHSVKFGNRWELVPVPFFSVYPLLYESCALSNQTMAEDKPWALISEVGKQAFIEEVTDIIKQHFNIICLRDFLQNPQQHGPKIQAILMWNTYPAAKPSLLNSLPSLKVVANGGVGIDHLDVPYITNLGVKVANTPGVVSDATADMAMGLLLASARKIVEGEVKGSNLIPGWSSLSKTQRYLNWKYGNVSHRSPNSCWPQDYQYTTKPGGSRSHRVDSGDHRNGTHRIQNCSEKQRV